MCKLIYVTILIILLFGLALAEEGKMPICGDPDNTGDITILDEIYIIDYLFNAGPPPSVLSEGNVDNSCRINMADVVYIENYINYAGPSPQCTDTTSCSYSTLAGNSVRIGCPPYSPYPGDDSVAIPVYIDNSETLIALSFGLYYPSADIEITSISTIGSIMPVPEFQFLDSIITADNKVLIGWFHFPGDSIAPQTGGLFCTLNAQILSGPVDQSIDLDSVFVPPGGDFIFIRRDASIIQPFFEPCLVIISSKSPISTIPEPAV